MGVVKARCHQSRVPPPQKHFPGPMRLRSQISDREPVPCDSYRVTELGVRPPIGRVSSYHAAHASREPARPQQNSPLA